MLQPKDASAGIRAEMHLHECLCEAYGGYGFPVITNLVCADDAAGANESRLQLFASVEVEAEGIACFGMEVESRSFGVRRCEPCLDVLRHAERVEYTATVGLDAVGED